MSQRFDVYRITRPRGQSRVYIDQMHNALTRDEMLDFYTTSAEVNPTVHATLGDALNAHDMGRNRPVHYVVMRTVHAIEAMRAEEV